MNFMDIFINNFMIWTISNFNSKIATRHSKVMRFGGSNTIYHFYELKWNEIVLFHWIFPHNDQYLLHFIFFMTFKLKMYARKIISSILFWYYEFFRGNKNRNESILKWKCKHDIHRVSHHQSYSMIYDGDILMATSKSRYTKTLLMNKQFLRRPCFMSVSSFFSSLRL